MRHWFARLRGIVRASAMTLFGLHIASSTGTASTGTVWAETPSAEAIDFFESHIRPTLIEHCYECHSAESESLGGSLRLDEKSGWMLGGDSGPTITPGDPAASELMAAIRYESTEMPPSGRLPDDVIAKFEKWIADGAADPRIADTPMSTGKPASAIDWEAAKQFWAFQPPRQPEPSAVKVNADTMIDSFLQAKMDEQGLRPVPAASPSVRLRRLAFDLTGLPPSPETLRWFQADPSDLHWRKLVETYLASPEYAEHWARHWMDVARYADSNGSDFNATHHDAWRYRDYLVRSFANDSPIDRMIREQIAGDLIPAANDQQHHDQVVATTFLMIGTKMLSERNKAKLQMDVVDEQVDTVGRAFLGMTFGCARCHDHKFDPISTRDYYAMAGVFRSTRTLHGESQEYVSTWQRTPLPTTPEHLAALKKHEADVKSARDAIKQAETELKSLAKKAKPMEGIVVDDDDAIRVGHWVESTYSNGFIGRGYLHDDNQNKGDASIRFDAELPAAGRYELRAYFNASGNRAGNVPVEVNLQGEKNLLELNQRKKPSGGAYQALGEFECAAGKHSVTLFNRGTDGYVIADAIQWVLVNGDKAKPAASIDSKIAVAVKRTKAKVDQLKSDLDLALKNKPTPRPTAMAVADAPTDEVADCPIHIRGEVNNLGDVVPRGVPQIFRDGSPEFTGLSGSGRLELAQWLTDPDHPLTARVSVNRIWMHLMGEGIVRTVDNFGQRGERPTHPELLDALTLDFVRNGWRQKRLIRQIVCSDAYSRAIASEDQDAFRADPANEFWTRMNRRRIPAESIRDAMLIAAGVLDRAGREDLMDGYATLVTNNNANSKADTRFGLGDPKRSIYLPVIRSEVPALLADLDAADPDLLVGKRPTTNVPAQALTLIGSPEVRNWAMQTAERMMAQTETNTQRVRWACSVLFAREPRTSDQTILTRWLNSDAAQAFPSDQERYREWIAAMFASTEFRFLD